MKVGIIPSGGNLTSVCAALDRLGASHTMVTTPTAMAACDRIILPGVGAAAATMQCLREFGLIEAVRTFAGPVLGICIGMQILFSASEEGASSQGLVPMLGILPGVVRRLQVGSAQRLPHMGWNRLDNGDSVYFVHSYRVPDGPWTVASTVHGERFPAQIVWGNYWGAQYHPEKSGVAGANYLRRFLVQEV